MKYIATREGVEVLTGKGPATEKQKEMVAKLLKDFPDVRDSFEYEDYKQAPTLHTASALISAALDSHMQNLQSENGYLKYIATRPGAEKHGAHGLFGREENTNLTAAMHDLTAHDGNVWTIIYSLHREDAERLGIQQRCRMAEAARQPAEQIFGSISSSSVGAALVRSLPRCGYAPAHSHDDLDRSGDGFETRCRCKIAFCNDQQHLSSGTGKSLYSKRCGV